MTVDQGKVNVGVNQQVEWSHASQGALPEDPNDTIESSASPLQSHVDEDVNS